jgi:hypothetical protein
MYLLVPFGKVLFINHCMIYFATIKLEASGYVPFVSEFRGLASSGVRGRGVPERKETLHLCKEMAFIRISYILE